MGKVESQTDNVHAREIYRCAAELSLQSRNFEQRMPTVLNSNPNSLQAEVASRFLVQTHFGLKAIVVLLREALTGPAWEHVKSLVEKRLRLRWLVEEETEKRARDFLDFRLAEEVEWHRSMAALPRYDSFEELETLERALDTVMERRGNNEAATFYHREEWCPSTTALLKEFSEDRELCFWFSRALNHRATGFPRDPDTDPTSSSRLLVFLAIISAFEIGADCESLLELEDDYAMCLPYLRERLEVLVTPH